MEEGKVKVYTLQEVTVYEEKTVFKKTKRTQKASDAVQIESNEVVAEQPEQAQEAQTMNAETVTNVKGASFAVNEEKNGIEIKFNNKPSNSVIESLKAQGFRWSNYSKLWYAKQSPDRLQFAQEFTRVYNSEAVAEPTEATEQETVKEPMTEAEAHRGNNFNVDTNYKYRDIHFKSWYMEVEEIAEHLTAYGIPFDEYGEKFIFKCLTIDQLKIIEEINMLNGAIIFDDGKYNENPNNSTITKEQGTPVEPEGSNVIYHSFGKEQEEETKTNMFDDILSKFDSVEVTAEQKIAADDLEFCKEQEKIYRLTINAYKSLNEQLLAVKPIAEAHGKKYGEHRSGYYHAKGSSYDSGFSVWDLDKNACNIKNRYISTVCYYFMSKYNITIDYEKIQNKHDTNVTYENVIDEITLQLGGYNFTEKASKEIKEKSKEAVRNADKISIKNNKLILDGYFVRHDSIWKEYRLNGQYQDVLKALQHFEDGSTSGNAELVNKYVGYDNERKTTNFERYEVQTMTKVKTIKFLKNGKLEIEFNSNQQARQFAITYCGYNLAA